MNTEQYYSVDVESSGPIPGKYSMLSLGACLVGQASHFFLLRVQAYIYRVCSRRIAGIRLRSRRS
jgi:hypothetical protein